MGWIKLDTRFFERPEVTALSKAAKLAYLDALTYCSRQRTEGVFHGRMARTCIAQADGDPHLVTAELVEAGLWRQIGDSFEIANYLDCEIAHPPREQDQMRTAWRALAPTLTPQVLARDGAICQYCGATSRLQIDHVQSIARGGTNDLENLQVLCQPCNGRKGDRDDLD